MDRRQFLRGTAAGAALAAFPTFAAEADNAAVTIRSREVTGPLSHIWENCAGSDRAAITLRNSCQQTYYRWRREYGGLKTDQARRMKDLEKENLRLRRAISVRGRR